MRDEDFYKRHKGTEVSDIDKYLEDLERLKRIRAEEKIKEENEKLYNAIKENNRKLEEINGDNVRKITKKSEKISIIGGNTNAAGKNVRNIKRNINKDSDTDNIKIPLPPKRQKVKVRKEDNTVRHEEPIKRTVKKVVVKPVTKKVIKKVKKIKKINTKASKTEQVKSNKPKKKRGFLKRLILLMLLFCILGGGTYFAFNYVTKQTGYYTVAVFGVDSRDGNVGEGALSDVNMIVNVNRETGDVQLVSIYRDMYSMIDDDGTFHKFNQAYANGGPEEAMKTLNRNLDLELKDYITVNWKAVIDAINILGGVDLEVTDAEFKYLNSFITKTVEATGVGSYQLEHAGMNHLDGVQAVAYARLRLMDTDFNRTERQRKVVSLAFDKAKKANFSTLYSILTAVLPQTSTNVGIDDLIPFARDISKYHLSETTGFPFDKDTKKLHKRDFVIPITLRSNVIALHQMLYGNIQGYSYTPSETLDKISEKIIEDSGMGADKEDTDINIDKDLEGAIGNAENKIKVKSAEHKEDVEKGTAENFDDIAGDDTIDDGSGTEETLETDYLKTSEE